MSELDETWLAQPDEVTPEFFPDLGTISPAFLYRFIPVPDSESTPPEYIFLAPPQDRAHRWGVKFDLTIAKWNTLWEAGPLVPQVIDRKWIPPHLKWLLKLEGRNIRLVQRSAGHRFDAYATLYHLLPAKVLRQAGLPLLKRGLWPHTVPAFGIETIIPEDFDPRLAEAFSRHVWPLLNGRSHRNAFASEDPIRILSHQLDFWLPYLDVVAQNRARLNGRCDFDDDDPTQEEDIRLVNERNRNSGAQAQRPWRGGELWFGEDDAWEATNELMDTADAHGRLRGIIDAVKSHRAQDDFSSMWSYEREDFARKLHHKRNKTKVVFTQLDNVPAVYSDESEIVGNLLWGDFLALLDTREKRVVVCLRNGAAGPTDIARELGYANHSPVSKALAKIRKKAEIMFGLN